jgi:Putative lumazine-binding
MRRLWWFVLLTAVPSALHAQDDRQAVLGVVKRLFDGMRARDTAQMRSVMDGSARLIDVTPAGAKSIDPGAWIGGVARGTGAMWDERIFDPEVRVDDNIATVWVYYEFWRGSDLSHCGIDAFFLVKSASGWRVNQVADTRRKDCKPR